MGIIIAIIIAFFTNNITIDNTGGITTNKQIIDNTGGLVIDNTGGK